MRTVGHSEAGGPGAILVVVLCPQRRHNAPSVDRPEAGLGPAIPGW